MRIVLAVIKSWAARLSIVKTLDMLKLHFNHEMKRDTVASIYFRLRQVCSLAIDKRNLKLGGPGKVVEIDESLYAKIKHWKGKLILI